MSTVETAPSSEERERVSAISAQMASRGWSVLALSVRWGLGRRRVHQVVACPDAECPLRYLDAVSSLPKLKPGAKPRVPAPLSPEAFRQAMERRGWDVAALAERWGMTRRRVQQIIAYDLGDRPRYYEDAVRGLPRRPRATRER